MPSKHSKFETEEEAAATTGGPFGQRVFVYMPTRGINLYPVKPPAASIQRLLVSLVGYLANENYDLTSTRFYCTGTLVSSACPSFPSFFVFTFSLAYASTPTSGQDQSWPAHPRLFSLHAVVLRNNSTCLRRYLSRSYNEDQGEQQGSFLVTGHTDGIGFSHRNNYLVGRKVVEIRSSLKKERKDTWNAICIYLAIGGWKKTEVRNYVYDVFLISYSFMVLINGGRKAR